MDRSRARCNYMNLIRVATFITSILITYLLCALINDSPQVNRDNIIVFGGWFFANILLFLIICSLFFYYSLSRVISAWFDNKYFWVSNLIISFISANIIYIKHISLEGIICLTQIFFWSALNILFIYFVFFPCMIYIIIKNAVGFLKIYIEEIYYQYIFKLLFEIILTPFGLISLILFNYVIDHEFGTPNCNSYNCLINDISNHLCVCLIIFFAAFIADLAIIELLNLCRYNYRPTGITKRFLALIYSIILPFIKKILEPINISFPVLPALQAIAIKEVEESPLSEDTKNILIVFLLIVPTIIYYYYKNYQKFDAIVILWGSFNSLIGVFIIYIVMSELYDMTLIASIINQVSNNRFLALIFILIISVLLTISMAVLNTLHLPIIIKKDYDKLLYISIDSVTKQSGGNYLSSKFQVKIKSRISRKNNILIAVGSSSKLLGLALNLTAKLINAKYVPVDGPEDLSDQHLADFRYDQAIDFDIVAHFPEGVNYESNSAYPKPTLEDKTFLKWSSQSLDTLKMIKFNLIVDQKEGSIYKKPEIEIESKYAAKSNRKLAINQTMTKIK